jgi:ribosomal-protein-alanine N-acetyltransferase
VLVNYDCRIIEVDVESDVVLAGYIICRYDVNICHILNLCITPALQGNGYGQSLLQEVIDSQKNSAVDTIILEVRPTNIAAMRLYQKMGFLQVGIKTGYYHDDNGIEDAVVLQKKTDGGSLKI